MRRVVLLLLAALHPREVAAAPSHHAPEPAGGSLDLPDLRRWSTASPAAGPAEIDAALRDASDLAVSLAPSPPSGDDVALERVLHSVRARAAPRASVTAAPGGDVDGILARGTLTPRPLDERFAEVFNVRDFGCRGDGERDDSSCVQAAVDAAHRSGGGTVFFPAGTYRITRQARLTPREPYGVLLHGKTRLLGVGPASVVRMTGVVPRAGGGPDDFAMFMVADRAELVVFERLRLQGENDPFVYTHNDQSAAILSATGGHDSDVFVHGCVFEHLHGFGFADRSHATRHSVIGNVFRYVANSGVNTGGGEAVVTNNIFFRSEGIEMGSHRSQISSNILVQSHGGISIGGLTGGGDVPERTSEANIIHGNVITDSIHPSGIVIADGAHDCIVANNVIARLKPSPAKMAIGINVSSGGYQAVRRNVIVGNVVRSTGAAGPVNMGIRIAGSDDNFVALNRVYDSPEEPGFATSIGIYLEGGAGNVVLGNDVTGAIRDVQLKASRNARIVGNVIRGKGGVLADAASSIAAEVVVGPWQHLGNGLGFFGAKPVARPVVSGSRGGNAALADLLAKLAELGLVTDATSP